MLRKRSRILRIVLAVTLVIAAAAVYGFVTATNARHQADARAREAIALKLTSQGESMLAGVQGGGDPSEAAATTLGQQGGRLLVGAAGA